MIEQSDHNFACCWPCSFFHGSWGPIPGCVSSSWVLGSRPWLFFSFFTSVWHVFHQTCILSSLLVNLPFKHTLLDLLLCVDVTPRFRISLHATLLSLVVRWLRRQPSRSPAPPVLDTCFSSFAPILGFGSSILPRSFASSRLTAIFWSSSSTSCHFRAASCATSSDLSPGHSSTAV